MAMALIVGRPAALDYAESRHDTEPFVCFYGDSDCCIGAGVAHSNGYVFQYDGRHLCVEQTFVPTIGRDRQRKERSSRATLGGSGAQQLARGRLAFPAPCSRISWIFSDLPRFHSSLRALSKLADPCAGTACRFLFSRSGAAGLLAAIVVATHWCVPTTHCIVYGRT